jgi:hypothetical protein
MSKHIMVLDVKDDAQLKDFSTLVGIIAQGAGIKHQIHSVDDAIAETIVSIVSKLTQLQKGNTAKTASPKPVAASKDTPQRTRGDVKARKEMGAQALFMKSKGATIPEIALKFQRSPQTIYNAMKLCKRRGGRRVVTPEFCIEVRDLRSEGYNAEEIASLKSVSPGTVYRALSLAPKAKNGATASPAN